MASWGDFGAEGTQGRSAARRGKPGDTSPSDLVPSPAMDPSARTPRGLVAGILLLHLALGTWALASWIGGPFLGHGILDGFEVLEIARHGSTGELETKSLLYPAILGAALRALGDSPWVVGALGLLLSSAALLLILRWTWAWAPGPHRVRAVTASGLAWTLSGSVYAFAVQPLPVVAATTALLGGLHLTLGPASEEGPRGKLRSTIGGVLLAAAVFARAPLLIPVLMAFLLLAATFPTGERIRRALPALGGLLAMTVLCILAFGSKAWPGGSAFNLRQGNGAERTGISDLRPGPRYEACRYEGWFAPLEADGTPPDPESVQRRLLLEEVRADPLGAARTLVRKAYLFWHRTEHHTAADFRHGLRGFAVLPLLLQSLGVLAPIALAGLLLGWRFGDRGSLRERAILAAPILGMWAVNTLYLTSARYRFPALPFLCIAFGLGVASLTRRRGQVLAVLLALVLLPNLSGTSLRFPGDGEAQEAHLLLSMGGASESAASALAEARALSKDPRTRYESGLWHERTASQAGAADPGEHIEAAMAFHRGALELEASYPQALENLMALLYRSGRTVEMVQLAKDRLEGSPYAGKARLMLAEVLGQQRGLALEHFPEFADAAGIRALRAEGHRILALRYLAQDQGERARPEIERARELGLDDPRFPR